jgi:hypothetical protein
MSPKTKAVFDEIRKYAQTGVDSIAPVTFSHCYGRAVTSAAFRAAKAQGVIVVSYISVAGTPCYKAGPNVQA